MRCDYFEAGACRSCTHLRTPYAAQLDAKVARTRAALAGLPGAELVTWLDPVRSAESGFRNRAKMVVGGTRGRVKLGVLDDARRVQDLVDCSLHSPGIHAALPVIAEYLSWAGFEPYDIAARRGEVKYAHVTESPSGELMLRFVLRSRAVLDDLRHDVPALRREIPGLRVVTANLLPEPKAVLEGHVEIVLTEADTLPMAFDGVTLHLRPQSFFQTNTEVAHELYGQASAWVRRLRPRSAWDLYCGVGGFALHAALAGVGEMHGVEVSAEAIASARLSAEQAGFAATFTAADATEWASGREAPELVIVNPPRRGIGPLAAFLAGSDARWVLYSSCNPTSLARDLAVMSERFAVREARLLDMFPHTDHAEVMTLLERR
ncbi:methyltransferase domain-containing protein [Micrococcales bacterium 31B]|nr:methyltransferase domain-containing protein [Micrococcales bacterium 31B]